jgi:hypothetical protein
MDCRLCFGKSTIFYLYRLSILSLFSFSSFHNSYFFFRQVVEAIDNAVDLLLEGRGIRSGIVLFGGQDGINQRFDLTNKRFVGC